MLRILVILSLASIFACILPASAAEPVRLILDTDIGNDVDDALALAMIHALQSRSEVRLLAVTITKDNRDAAPFVDLVNTFYGRPDIPVGMVHNGKTPEDAPMLRVPVTRRDPSGALVYPHRLEDSSRAPEAVELLKRILAEQPDGSVTIAQIGFSTNLARLIGTPDGRELVSRKVKMLCAMAGNFTQRKPEFNVYTDPDSARRLFAQWPTPVVLSGFEIGLAITFPYQAIEKNFGYAVNHPIVDAYKLYVGKPVDHPNWDSTAVLQAIRPDCGYFNLSPPGRVEVRADNTTAFVPAAAGNCRYLVLKNEEVERVKAVIATLVSEPPHQLPQPEANRAAK